MAVQVSTSGQKHAQQKRSQCRFLNDSVVIDCRWVEGIHCCSNEAYFAVERMPSGQPQKAHADGAQNDLEKSQAECICRKYLDQHGQHVGIQWGLIKRLSSVPIAGSDLFCPIDIAPGIAHQLNHCWQFKRLQNIQKPQKKCYQANDAQ